eukprot:COSAG04_NODE_617_length_11897_cov_27.308696_6_plen_111_part_00
MLLAHALYFLLFVTLYMVRLKHRVRDRRYKSLPTYLLVRRELQIWSVIHHSLKMTNEIHQPFIYSTLDWTDSEAPVDITFLMMAVISVVITLSWCVSMTLCAHEMWAMLD